LIGVEEKNISDQNIVTITPNPFSEKVIFYFNIKVDDPGDMNFSIFSLDGRMVHEVSLTPGQKRVEWSPGNLVSPQTLIYRLEMDHHVVGTGKFVRL
jgi:hypothetical protein